MSRMTTNEGDGKVSRHKGIKLRHRKGCAKTPSTCTPSYRPTVYGKHAGRKLEGPTFRTLAEAKQWRERRRLSSIAGFDPIWASTGRLSCRIVVAE